MLGKLIGCAELKGKLVPTSYKLQLLSGHEWYSHVIEISGIQIALGFSKPTSEQYKRPPLAAFWD